MRDRIRTALVLTVSAAAAALVPAAAAHAASVPEAGPLPAAGVDDMLPASAVTDTLPASAVTDMLPASTIEGVVPTQAVTGALGNAVGPVKNLTLDPLSHTGVDPLDNAVGGQVADFKPVSTAAVTGPVTSGGSLATMPVVGTAAGMLPG